MDMGVLTPMARCRSMPLLLPRLLPLKLSLAQVIILIPTLVAGCVLCVWARSSVLHERYLLEEAQREQARIQMEHRTLRLTWATLTSPKALEEAARKRFNLHHPGPREVVRLP